MRNFLTIGGQEVWAVRAEVWCRAEFQGGNWRARLASLLMATHSVSLCWELGQLCKLH